MANPETAKTLSQTVQSVDTSAKLFAKVTPRFKKFSVELKEAIEKESLAKVELYLPEMEEVAEEIDNGLHAAKGSLALIGHLKKDKAFLEQKFDTVEKLTVKVANIETCLVDWRKQTVELVKKGRAAIGKLEAGNNELLGDLAALKDQYNDLVKAVEHMEKEGAKFEAETLKMQAAGNEKAMSAARMKFLNMDYTNHGIGAVRLLNDVKNVAATGATGGTSGLVAAAAQRYREYRQESGVLLAVATFALLAAGGTLAFRRIGARMPAIYRVERAVRALLFIGSLIAVLTTVMREKPKQNLVHDDGADALASAARFRVVIEFVRLRP